jgi:hypothetical protein
MSQVYVTPRLQDDGTPFIVRQPNRAWTPLPVDGGWVTIDEYWSRRLRDGDVIESASPAEPGATPQPSETATPAASSRRNR